MRTEFLGEEKLIKQAKVGFPKGITKINNNVYFALGYGGSTCTLIIGKESCVLIDTLNGMSVAKEARKEFEKITNKPINTIVYTHYLHFDHTSGTKAFAKEDTVIIGKKPSFIQYGKTALIKDVCGVRGARQFGAGLSAEESISVGIGPRNDINSEKGILPCNVTFENEIYVIDLDGLRIELHDAPGETDDHLFVWIPEYKVLCCGDNFYESWPNIYAIRGSQYRNVSSWVDGLQKMIDLNPKFLLPGHTHCIIGEDSVKETLTNYRGALDFVLTKTLEGMNDGKTIEELVEEVVLPEEYAKLPYLQEYYGTVAWSVRAIFTGYLGWFDGNATNLGHMNISNKAKKTIKMMGGPQNIIEEIETSLENEEEQWAVELCDLLLNAKEEVEKAKELKARGLVILGRMQTSANARHYYLMSAKQILGNGPKVVLKGASLDAQKY